MDKVKISRDVAQAIGGAIATYTELGFKNVKEHIIRVHSKNPDAWSSEGKHLNGLPLDTLIRALYIGYEVEQTPEDKVREWYKNQQLILDASNDEDKVRKSCWMMTGADDVLDLLNIKIEGVNA